MIWKYLALTKICSREFRYALQYTGDGLYLREDKENEPLKFHIKYTEKNKKAEATTADLDKSITADLIL